MPIDTGSIGRSTDYFEHHVDVRWLMAYAAGLDDLNPAYMDTTAGTVHAHPIFPVCLEWPAILAARALLGENLSDAESARGVHAAHDLHLFRPITAGTTLRTKATLLAIEKIKPGAGYTLRLDTVDESEQLVCQTYQFGIYRDVPVIGATAPATEKPALPATQPLDGTTTTIAVAAGSAHRYTECARIWNPIHTDRQFAQNAGLPDIILHGTATMALAVTELTNRFVAGDPQRVVRTGGRFAATVLMPSTLELNTSAVRQQDDGTQLVSFVVANADAALAINHGFFVFR